MGFLNVRREGRAVFQRSGAGGMGGSTLMSVPPAQGRLVPKGPATEKDREDGASPGWLFSPAARSRGKRRFGCGNFQRD